MAAHFLDHLFEGEDCPKERVFPQLWYNDIGDCVHYQTVDEGIVGERIDSLLTIFRSAVNNRPIGFQVKDIGALADKYGADVVDFSGVSKQTKDGEITDLKFRLAFLLNAALSEACNEANGRPSKSRMAAYAEAQSMGTSDAELVVA